MTALERAEEDVQRGEHWLARRRLESHLLSCGYDPVVLVRLGEIAYEMHDAYTAGRAWLLSSAEGDHVETAIGIFVKHAGLDPESVVARLYRSAWPKDLKACSPTVQGRVERLGLTEAIVRGPRKNKHGEHKTSWGERILIAVALGLLLFCMVSCCVGVTKIFSWVFGWE